MEEEKFTPVGGGDEPGKKGFKVKVITLLLFIIIVIAVVVIACLVLSNKRRKLDETLASAKVEYDLNRIKMGDDEALEKYLSYSELLTDSEEIDEEFDNEEDEEEITEIDESDIVDDTEETIDDSDNEDDLIDVDESEEDMDDDYIFKMFLNTLNYEITNVNVENNNATVTAKISNKNSGEIFRNYFTRAIKLAITQALSTSTNDDGKIQEELQTYLEEQVASSEIPVTTNEVTFTLAKENNEWQVKSQDKDMVDVILPDLMDTIADLSEEFGEYGD